MCTVAHLKMNLIIKNVHVTKIIQFEFCYVFLISSIIDPIALYNNFYNLSACTAHLLQHRKWSLKIFTKLQTHHRTRVIPQRELTPLPEGT